VIGIDTNVLVRFLTDDDHAQALAARDLLEARSGSDPAHISLIVLVETLWVLQGSYGYSRADACSLVARMLAVDGFRFERRRVVERAVDLAQTGGLDLPDALIAVSNDAAGCAETLTFDRRAARIPGMVLMKP
jgi:predicted nucleic-acid-binding protein